MGRLNDIFKSVLRPDFEHIWTSCCLGKKRTIFAAHIDINSIPQIHKMTRTFAFAVIDKQSGTLPLTRNHFTRVPARSRDNDRAITVLLSRARNRVLEIPRLPGRYSSVAQLRRSPEHGPCAHVRIAAPRWVFKINFVLCTRVEYLPAVLPHPRFCRQVKTFSTC